MAGGIPAPRVLSLRNIGSDRRLDRGLVAWFPGPRSFTGEDCAELHLHGSPAGVRAVLRDMVALGARLAEAGEFTRRAFENGKLDLVEIEGLGDLLQAETENQRRQALARLEGGLTAEVDGWRRQLLELRAEIEARLDFSDEGDVQEALPAQFDAALAGLAASLGMACNRIESGRIIREGIRVAIAGAPNAGKSSLINALARSDIAIVTDEAGTTRDVREVPLDIGGQLFVLLDTAGLRTTDSKAEAEGVRRARLAIDSADIVVWVSAPDVRDTAPAHLPENQFRVANKSDLSAGAGLTVSAATGEGLEALIGRLQSMGEGLAGSEFPLVSRSRDRHALEAARDAISESRTMLSHPELAAESLRRASQALERLTGRIDSEHVLDRLFSSFCIGK
jgi:tRNA modification GTPase